MLQRGRKGNSGVRDPPRDPSISGARGGIDLGDIRRFAVPKIRCGAVWAIEPGFWRARLGTKSVGSRKLLQYTRHLPSAEPVQVDGLAWFYQLKFRKSIPGHHSYSDFVCLFKALAWSPDQGASVGRTP